MIPSFQVVINDTHYTHNENYQYHVIMLYPKLTKGLEILA